MVRSTGTLKNKRAGTRDRESHTPGSEIVRLSLLRAYDAKEKLLSGCSAGLNVPQLESARTDPKPR